MRFSQGIDAATRRVYERSTRHSILAAARMLCIANYSVTDYQGVLHTCTASTQMIQSPIPSMDNCVQMLKTSDADL